MDVAIEESIMCMYYEDKLKLKKTPYASQPLRGYPHYPPRNYTTVYEGYFNGNPVCVIVSGSVGQARELDYWFSKHNFNAGLRGKEHLHLIESGKASFNNQNHYFILTERFEEDDLCGFLLKFSMNTVSSISEKFDTIFQMFSTISEFQKPGYRDIYIVANKVKFGREFGPLKKNVFVPEFYLDIIQNFFCSRTKQMFLSWDFYLLHESVWLMSTIQNQYIREKNLKTLLSIYPDSMPASWIISFILLNVDSVKNNNLDGNIRTYLNQAIVNVFQQGHCDCAIPSVYADHSRRSRRGDKNSWEEIVASKDRGKRGNYWEKAVYHDDGPCTMSIRNMIWGNHRTNKTNNGKYGLNWKYGCPWECLCFIRTQLKHRRENKLFFTDRQIVDILDEAFPHILFLFWCFLVDTNTLVLPK